MYGRTHILLGVLVAIAALPAACGESSSGGGSSGGSSTGTGGEGGACPMGPQAMFDLTITAQKAPVPPDTTVDVSWSAAKEPTFALDHPETWMTLEQANVVCDVDPAKPPPKDLKALVCHLWTIGATEVMVHAKGYEPVDQTFTPTKSEHCNGPIPTPITVELVPAMDPDAGGK